jgi:hypothetical protein
MTFIPNVNSFYKTFLFALSEQDYRPSKSYFISVERRARDASATCMEKLATQVFAGSMFFHAPRVEKNKPLIAEGLIFFGSYARTRLQKV